MNGERRDMVDLHDMARLAATAGAMTSNVSGRTPSGLQLT
jgi:hypothetical protein